MQEKHGIYEKIAGHGGAESIFKAFGKYDTGDGKVYKRAFSLLKRFF